jgi:hypothetical protein
MRRDQVGVAGVAVAHDGAGVAGQYPTGVDVVFGSSAGVHRGEELPRRDVDVFQVAGGAAGDLIGVEYPDLA